MQFTVASLLALAAGASALPSVARQEGKIAPNTPFKLVAIRSGSDIQYSSFSAALGGILLSVPAQNASCNDASRANDGATFTIDEQGAGWLYSDSNPRQQLWVDRSGMGQGIWGFTTGAQNAPRNSERTGWALDDANDLTFDGASFIACPNAIDGAWRVWVNAGHDQPGGSSGCLGIKARASAVAEPNSCLYTQAP
ncbi:cell wall protein PhiA [Biscogniauxia marginata]|nr:cell wall protein PhiA [Biscogniauxia marginata]